MGVNRTLGMLGSAIGAVAIVFDVYFLGLGADNWIPTEASIDILLINTMLWVLWFAFQGSGFLGIYHETDAAISVVAFIFGLGAAVLQFFFHFVLIRALQTTDWQTSIALLIFFIPLFFATIGIQVVYMLFAGIAFITTREHFDNTAVGAGAGALCIIGALLIWAPLWSLGVALINIVLIYAFHAQSEGVIQMPPLVKVEPPPPNDDGAIW